MTEKTLDQKLQELRAPFPENLIGWLPKPMLKKEEMDKLPKHNCPLCGQYHASAKVMHLSYVGHAALTDRLLDVDPSWSWEPLSVGQDGYPVVDRDGGMWIKLTVLGITKIGYGEAQAIHGKNGGNATKERIGDALRNAAMRFGCALEMWHKGDLNAHKINEFIPEQEAELPAIEKRGISNKGFNDSMAKISSGELSIDRFKERISLTKDQESALSLFEATGIWNDLEVSQ